MTQIYLRSLTNTTPGKNESNKPRGFTHDRQAWDKLVFEVLVLMVADEEKHAEVVPLVRPRLAKAKSLRENSKG